MRILSGYQKPAVALAVSADGSRLYSAATSQVRLWVWDLASGELEKKLPNTEMNSYAGALACSGDGGRLFVAGVYSGLAVWALPDGPAECHLTHRDDATSERPDVALHPGGRLVALPWQGWSNGKRYGAQVWDAVARERKHLFRGFGEEVRAVAFSPAGLLAASDGATVRLFDSETGKEAPKLDHAGKVGRLAFRRDGAALAAAWGGTVSIHDLKTRKPAHDLAAHAAAVTGIGYSPDGKYLASVGRDGLVILHDAVTHEPLGRRHLEVGAIGVMCWLPDSSGLVAGGEKLIAVCELAELLGTERPRPKARGEPLSLAGHKKSVTGLSYSPDGGRLCSWGTGGMRMWDLSAGAGQARPLEGFTGMDYYTGDLSWSPDGARLAISLGPAGFGLLDSATGKAARRVSPAWIDHVLFTPGGELFDAFSGPSAGDDWFVIELRDAGGEAVLFSKRVELEDGKHRVSRSSIPGADGRHVYLVVRDSGVYRWAPRADELVRMFRQDTAITGFAVSADERLALTIGGNRAFVWPLGGAGRRVEVKHALSCSGAAFLPGGRLITSCYDGVVRVWDLSGGRELYAFDLGMGKVYCLAVSPDHMTFAAGVHKQNRIVLMDVPD